MPAHFQEVNLPSIYRQSEIECILASLVLQRSLQVAGLSGLGKSTLLRFLTTHPTLISQHPDFIFEDVFIFYIDCNALNPATPLNFFRECNFQLPEPERDIVILNDDFLLYKQVQEQLAAIPREQFVILVIDQISNLIGNVDDAFFGQLRNLRDQVRGNDMAFVLGEQRPISNLYHLAAIFGDTCWVKPVNRADGQTEIVRHLDRLRLKLTEDQQQTLQRITGNHPGFLKNSLEEIKRTQSNLNFSDDAVLITQLIDYGPLRSHCQRLWESLELDEQTYIIDLETATTLQPTPTVLVDSGLIISGNQPRIFSPLWVAYLREAVFPQETIGPMRVELNDTTRYATFFWRGQTVDIRISRNLVFNLLSLLNTRPGDVFNKDELVLTLYPGEKGYETFEEAIFQLVTALRRLIDPTIKELCPAMSESCIQNVRGIGYRLMVDLPTPT